MILYIGFRIANGALVYTKIKDPNPIFMRRDYPDRVRATASFGLPVQASEIVYNDGPIADFVFPDGSMANV
jgi:hypothetical protein